MKFTTSGYTGGRVSNPSYEQVSRGSTGHAEAIEVAFDPAVVTYAQVLDYFWRHIDPFVAHRQFCDVGGQYRPEIFVRSEAQRVAAEASKKAMAMRFREPVVVPISDARTFYPADESHQDYYLKHPAQYATIAGAVVATHDCRRSGARSSIPNAQDPIPNYSQLPTPKGDTQTVNPA